MPLTIIKIKNSQINEVADIHLAALPNDVLPNLGRNFLLSYYKSIIDDKSQKLFGAVLNESLVGFCLISSGNARLGKLIFNAKGILALLRLLITRPLIFYSAMLQALKKNKIDENTAELSFIAVLPHFQGNNIGTDLLNHANKWCSDSDISFLQTKTANKALRMFYIKNYQALEIQSFKINNNEYSELKWVTSLSSAKPCHA